MSIIAEKVAAAIDTFRNCTIEIDNSSEFWLLKNPGVHMYSGYMFRPPQPTLSPNATDVCAFSKNEGAARGVEGVLTYELHSTQDHHFYNLLAIMFCVPFNYHFFDNLLAVGIFEPNRPCNEALFNRMHNEDDPSNFTRVKAKDSAVMFAGQAVEVRATMSSGGRAMIKVEIHDKTGL